MSDPDNRTNPDTSTSGDSTIGATPGNTNDRADDVKDKYRQTADQVRNVARRPSRRHVRSSENRRGEPG